MSEIPHLTLSEEQIADFCRRYHVRRMALFGSVLRDDFRPDSDVDVLVEFEPGTVVGFKIGAMQNELAALLGRRVDLRTPAGLSRYFRQKVLESAEVIYERAG